MRRLFTIAVGLLLLGSAAAAQEDLAGKTLLVLPFENKSSAPGLEWTSANARSEAEAATRLNPNAESYILLGTLQLKSNQAELARQQAATALRLEPGNAAAQALQQAATSRLPQSQ